MMSDTRREFPRKMLRCHAFVGLPGAAPLHARTLDISIGGICMIIGEELHTGQECAIGFETPLNGKMVRVTAAARVVYSILSGTEGFRTGMQFVRLDEENHRIVAELTM